MTLLTTKQVQVITSGGARIGQNVPKPVPNKKLGWIVNALATAGSSPLTLLLLCAAHHDPSSEEQKWNKLE